ncbi:F18B13.22 protein isoform 3 [Hibiscus syriacus]|uniref:F18B13.22 protein isoform 3 n=1 Tax=Hibiscus syriacus TaxID=106335 RepID=A0A6A2WSW8_HIBSY|nr:F18B13.22 protein isoform 3 [Hibiscus syriacus]
MYWIGAVVDGTADNSEALLKAWNFVCSREVEDGVWIILVPGNQTFLLRPLTFNGPCKAKEIKFLIMGRIISPISPETWEGFDQGRWLTFNRVSGLEIKGRGEIDGRGWGWWNQSCRYHPHLGAPCTSLAPTVSRFLDFDYASRHRSLSQVRLVYSSQTHVLIRGTNDFIVDDEVITTPETSPNTDGIHISSASNIFIRNSIIGTVWTWPWNKHWKLRKGKKLRTSAEHSRKHGILQRNYEWSSNQDMAGVTFENLSFEKEKNLIIIDQNYCNVRGACGELETGVKIRDMVYKNLRGTSSTEVAITLNCSRSVSCTGLLLQSVLLKSALTGTNVSSSCINAYGAAIGVFQPAPCFQDFDH